MSEEQNLTYFQRLQKIKLDQLPKEAVAKKPKPLKKVSDKKKAEDAAAKKELGEDETMKERWFKKRRLELSGTCGCGCGCPSSKYDDKNFRSSICHIFPQRLFPSIQFHHLNWVERKFWATATTSACHSQMDNKSMDLWVNFADFDDIKAKYHELVQCLTDEEKTQKFYHHLTSLVYDKK
jgi:hypothetical protein